MKKLIATLFFLVSSFAYAEDEGLFNVFYYKKSDKTVEQLRKNPDRNISHYGLHTLNPGKNPRILEITISRLPEKIKFKNQDQMRQFLRGSTTERHILWVRKRGLFKTPIATHVENAAGEVSAL